MSSNKRTHNSPKFAPKPELRYFTPTPLFANVFACCVNKMEGEHSNSPEYIFVFGDEVFNIVILVFVPPYTLYP